jgi:predicted  nucleic acid-binding Zn-ribbon protein
MFNNFFYVATNKHEDRFSKLERLAEIETELDQLVEVRDRLMEQLSRMRGDLEGHRRESLEVRMRALDLFNRIARRIEETSDSAITPEEEKLLYQLDAWRQRLEVEVANLERKLKVAMFEAESLETTLNELREAAANIAAELDDEETAEDLRKGN